MSEQRTFIEEMRARQKHLEEILSYPHWQYIIQFERHRDRLAVDRYVFPKNKHNPVLRRRRAAGVDADLGSVAPAQLPVKRSHRIGSRCIDAIETGKRLEKKFLPKLKRQQRGGVDFFYCVEDYSNLNAHASAFVGNVHESRFPVATLVRLAEESGLTIGDEKGRYLVTRWEDQWFEQDGLARYLTKSMVPTRFGSPSAVLNSSSGVIGYSDTLVRHLAQRRR